MSAKNLWLIHTKQDPIKGQLLLRHIWKGTPNECFSLWRFNEDVVIGNVRQYTTLNGSFRDYYKSFAPQYLYVTNQDPYSAGDWVKNVTIEAEPPFKLDVHGIRYTQLAPCRFEKVVLTTDEYLIQDGISSVEEEFLNWFCEKANDSGKAIDIVEVKKNYLSNNGEWKEVLLPSEWEADTKVGYKIVVPNKEPKQDYTALLKAVGTEQDINTCKYFDQEVGCDLVDCQCEKQEILSNAKEKAKQDFLMSLEKDPLLAEFDNQVEQYKSSLTKPIDNMTTDEMLVEIVGYDYRSAGFPYVFLDYSHTFGIWSVTWRNPMCFSNNKQTGAKTPHEACKKALQFIKDNPKLFTRL